MRGRYYMYICNCMRVPNDENDEKKGWRAIANELEIHREPRRERTASYLLVVDVHVYVCLYT